MELAKTFPDKVEEKPTPDWENCSLFSPRALLALTTASLLRFSSAAAAADFSLQRTQAATRSSLSALVVVVVVVAATYFFVRYFIFARFSTKFCDWSRLLRWRNTTTTTTTTMRRGC